MYIFITQCFASRLGGIENLMTHFALTLSKKNEVKIFADQHLYVQDQIFDFENKSHFKVFRYGGIKILRRYKKAKDIKFFIEQNKIEGIIADTWKSLELCIDEINKAKIPVLCLAHGNELVFNNERKKAKAFKVLNKIPNIVANSKYTAELVKSLDINKSKVHIVNPGAKDLRSLETKNSYNFTGDPILITLARLELRKGHQNVLHSIKKLKDNFPNIQYVIAGEGPERNSLIKLTKDLEIQDHVIFLGEVNDQQKKEIFESASLMVMPTSDQIHNRSVEGFGIAYIEAAIFGICSVATNIGGVSDAIIDGETGILINSENDLYDCLNKILSDKIKLNKLGNQAKERALQRFSWNVVIEKYLGILKINSY